MIDWSKMKTAEQLAAEVAADENRAVEAAMREVDLKSIRALRAVAAGTATQADIDSLKAREAEVAALRAKVKKP